MKDILLKTTNVNLIVVQRRNERITKVIRIHLGTWLLIQNFLPIHEIVDISVWTKVLHQPTDQYYSIPCIYSVLVILYGKLVNQYARPDFHLSKFYTCFAQEKTSVAEEHCKPLYILNVSLYLNITLQSATAAAYEVEAIAWLFKDPLWFNSRMVHLSAWNILTLNWMINHGIHTLLYNQDLG